MQTSNSANIKQLKFLFLLILISTLFACKKSTPTLNSEIGVDKYIELLKLNRYDSLTLPKFTYQQIPALLKYRNESQLISNFPRNGISSFYGRDCSLGMYVLWTIESIRAVAINSEFLIMRFPSQNPILALKGTNKLTLIYSDDSRQVVAKAYFDWWENNKQKNFNQLKNINPLASTIYRWH